jgi:ATP-dependent RNA helicase DeaD
LCVLIVTHSQRRKAETLLGAARLQVTWASAPTAEDIHARDQERFLTDPIFTDPATEAEQALVQHLQSGLGADAIALALVRLHRARLPAPEDLAAADRFGDDRRRPRADMSSGRGPRDGGAEREPRPRREDGRQKVWFRLNIGRERNADPKWILPLICKAGDISKAEIGAIKIQAHETRFEIAADHADEFAAAVQRNKHKEGHIARIGGSDDGGDAAAATAFRSTPPPAGRPARAPGGDNRAKASWGDRDRPQNGPRSGARSHGDHKGRTDDRGGGGQKLQRRRMSGNGKAAR